MIVALFMKPVLESSGYLAMASHGHTTVESEDRPEAQLPCCAPCCNEILASSQSEYWNRTHGWARASRSVEMPEPDAWQH